MPPAPERQGRVYLFLILANLFWAGNFIFGKAIVEEFTPLQMTTLRWGVAVIPLLVIAHLVEKPDWRAALSEWWKHALLALLGLAGYNILMYEALRFTTSLDAALIGAVNPAIIVVLAAWLLRERIGGRGALGLVVSLLGVLLVLTRGDFAAGLQVDFNAGDLLMLVAVLAWAGYSILGRTLKRSGPITATAIQAVVTMVVLTPVMFASGGVSLAVSPGALWGMLYVAIFPSILSFILWNISVSKIGPSRASVFLNLIAVFTAVLGLFLGQSISLVQVAGGLLVFAGVYLTTRAPRADGVGARP